MAILFPPSLFLLRLVGQRGVLGEAGSVNILGLNGGGLCSGGSMVGYRVVMLGTATIFDVVFLAPVDAR